MAASAMASSAAVSPGPAHSVRSDCQMCLKERTRGGSPSTLTQLCWAWGSGPLLHRIPVHPSAPVPGPSTPWQQKPRCTVGGEGTGEIRAFLRHTALLMAMHSCHRPFARALPVAQHAPPGACLRRVCTWTASQGKGTRMDCQLRKQVDKERWEADSPRTSKGS